MRVSVIIPVYNTAKYLQEAIASISNQTLVDLEIIAINDGSTDNSLEVLKTIAENESRLQIINCEQNVGVSICRNKGLEVARGEYIYFFDSDDLLEPNCLELCCAKLNQTKADFLIFDGDSFSEEGIKQSFNATYQRTHLLNSEVYKGVELIRLLIDKKSYSCSICLCVIRKSYLDRIQLKFYPGVLFEDMLFTAHLYLAATAVSFAPYTFFKRRIRANSTMTSSISKKNIAYRFTVGNELLKLKKQFSDTKSKFILNHQSRSIFVFLVKLLLRNRQWGLLVHFMPRIKWMIFRSFWL